MPVFQVSIINTVQTLLDFRAGAGLYSNMNTEDAAEEAEDDMVEGDHDWVEDTRTMTALMTQNSFCTVPAA